MQLDNARSRRWRAALVAGVIVAGVAATVGSGGEAAGAAAGPAASSNTSSFRGVNWADPHDNFANGPVVPSELSTNDNYATTYAKSIAVLRGFRSKLGANTVRLPVNPYSAGTAWWNSYRAAIAAAGKLGFKVILAYWEGTGSNADGKVDDLSSWWSMWRDLTRTYRNSANVYFEPMNEPHGYTEAEWEDLAAQWLDRFPDIPRGRVIVGGSGYEDHVGGVCADPRLAGTLLGLHDYGFWGTKTYDEWMTDLQDRIGGCASRTILDEFGVPMATGIDYDGSSTAADAATNNYVAFLQAATDTLRQLDMGSVYWPGLRTDDTYSMTTASGSGSDISLSVNDQSGLDRLHWGWGYPAAA